MKTLLSVIAFFFALSVQAQTCAKLDFAELDSLPKEQLLQMRCEYQQNFLQGYRRCSDETNRMDRIIARKYQLKNKGEEDLPYYVEINALCRKK